MEEAIQSVLDNFAREIPMNRSEVEEFCGVGPEEADYILSEAWRRYEEEGYGAFY